MFKVGDKVVFVKDPTILKLRTAHGLIGKTFTIQRKEYNFYRVEETNNLFREEWLVLLEVFLSPLYQLLKEEE